MLEQLTYTLLTIVGPPIVIFAIWFVYLFIKFYREEQVNSKVQEVTPQKLYKALLITAHSEEIVGFYQDKPIYAKVAAEDGKFYDFESVVYRDVPEHLGPGKIVINNFLVYTEAA